MSSVTFIRHPFLPVQSIRLGRFVRNRDEPQSDYLDPQCDNPRQPIIKPHLNYGEVQQIAAGGDFSVFLMSLLSTSWSKKRKQYVQVTTGQVTTYQLDNSGTWFKEAVKSDTTREWIKESIDQGDDIYVVVGYSTMLDAVVVEGSAELARTSAQATVPLTESLGAAGVVVPLGNIADPGISGNSANHHGMQRHFVAPGEQVCAVQYRKVSFKWFSSRDMDKAFLHHSSRWKLYSNIRGHEIGTNDVVEVDLADTPELGDGHEVFESEAYGRFTI